MAVNKNNELNDEMMAQANGGMLEFTEDVATITGIVMVDPYPDGQMYVGMFEECQRNGYTVYEVSDGRLAVASPYNPEYSIGDQVILNAIRGCYGWEIDGVIDGPVVM